MSDEDKQEICCICRDWGEAHCDTCELAAENEMSKNEAENK